MRPPVYLEKGSMLSLGRKPGLGLPWILLLAGCPRLVSQASPGALGIRVVQVFQEEAVLRRAYRGHGISFRCVRRRKVPRCPARHALRIMHIVRRASTSVVDAVAVPALHRALCHASQWVAGSLMCHLLPRSVAGCRWLGGRAACLETRCVEVGGAVGPRRMMPRPFGVIGTIRLNPRKAIGIEAVKTERWLSAMSFTRDAFRPMGGMPTVGMPRGRVPWRA